MDRVIGLDAPGTPGWTLNETTDLLLKKNLMSAENCRGRIVCLRQMATHLVPFDHPDMDKWRDLTAPWVIGAIWQHQYYINRWRR